MDRPLTARRALILLAAFATTLVLAAPALAFRPYIHGHRGGSIVNGQPRYPENTLPAFRHSARAGFVLELDVKLTKDRVPVVIHDATLDRTTPCTGRVADKTLAELRPACDSDILGSEGNSIQLAAGDRRRAPIPTLREVLELARDTGARLNLEIKNLPTDPDFDGTSAFANRVMDTITDPSIGFPPSHLIIQSFWPPNLDVAKQRLPGVETSLLSAGPGNQSTVNFAKSRGYDWLSPSWPTPPDVIAATHAAGLRIVPYTIDTAPDIAAAARAGVDALITNDPTLARRVVAAAEPKPPPIPPPPSPAACRAARASRSLPTITAYGPHRHGVRVFAMQTKQDARNAVSYATFRTKIECLIRERVAPRLAHGEPNVVAFNEDIGLLTIGDRVARRPGARVRRRARLRPGLRARLGAVRRDQGAALHRQRLPRPGGRLRAALRPPEPVRRRLRGPHRHLRPRLDAGVLRHGTPVPRLHPGLGRPEPVPGVGRPERDRDVRRPGPPRPSSVFVATSPKVYNEAFMWGPQDVRREGPRAAPQRRRPEPKVPLTDIELGLRLSTGPSEGARRDRQPAPVPAPRHAAPGSASRRACRRSSTATRRRGTDPCSDTRKYYMRCLDRLGTNLVMQDEANPGRWATARLGRVAAARVDDLDVARRRRPERPLRLQRHRDLVGNLVDLPFDGQTAITQRGLEAAGARAAATTSATRR